MGLLTGRRLSIRTRTAITFAVVFMVLATGVLAFVNVMTQIGVVAVVDRGPAASVSKAPPASGEVALVHLVAEQQWLWAAVGVGAAGLLAGLAGWVVSRRMLRPLDAIARTARRISATTLDRRISLGGPDDELRRLARTIDDLFARLEAAFTSQRRFVAQASHELRTPLAVQRAAIQIGLADTDDVALISRTRDDLLDANRRTEELVEGLLVLAEAERGLDGRTVPIALGTFVADVVREHSGAAHDANVRLRGGAAPGLPTVPGDPVLVRQLLRNLVDNAIEYNLPGGAVDLRVDPGRLVVENTGPSLSAEQLETIREPFVRVDPHAPPSGPRRHSGIGLSIVDAVVRAHGWSMVLHGRRGGGLVVEITTEPVSSVSPDAERR